MPKSTSLVAIMRLSEVKAWLCKNDIPALNEYELSRHIVVDETGPFVELTDSNTYATSESIRKQLPVIVMRFMECEVVTCLQEFRWLMEVHI